MFAGFGKRVIVADDDAAMRKLLQRYLEKAGYEVLMCDDGQEALEAIRQQETCIVVADWMMPKLTGLELCEAVQQLKELGALRLCFFVLLTAQSDKSMVVRGLEAGADDYIVKPCHYQELVARIKAGQRICELQEQLWERSIQIGKMNGEMQRAYAELGRLNDRLEKLANTDTLTELPNRRHLFARFEDVWETAHRYDRPLSCIMLDIDKFKGVNDTYGHAAGDFVLKEVAAVLRAQLRKSDLPGRFGGEEFCVVCPETSQESANVLAERIRSRVESRVFEFEGQVMPVTVSVGVAERSTVHEHPDMLLAAADEMLYRAKSGGRNQVWEATSSGGRRVQSVSEEALAG